MCGHIWVTGATLAFFLSTVALAQDEAPETEAPPGAKGASSALKPTIVNLVFKSVDLVGKPVDLGGKPGTLGGKPADVGGKVEDLAIKETETEVRIELSGDILFDFDKATLRPAAEPILTRVAEVIRKYGKPMVRIDGHTDSKGSDDYNLKLSQRRADSVKDWLIANRATGVLTTKGLGETSPAVPNDKPDGSDDPDGRQKNRRVEIIVKKS
jgi:outer membrane protein OmpA-like peptidoglycan-associated protein